VFQDSATVSRLAGNLTFRSEFQRSGYIGLSTWAKKRQLHTLLLFHITQARGRVQPLLALRPLLHHRHPPHHRRKERLRPNRAARRRAQPPVSNPMSHGGSKRAFPVEIPLKRAEVLTNPRKSPPASLGVRLPFPCRVRAAGVAAARSGPRTGSAGGGQ
jgi:hypothetical protein